MKIIYSDKNIAVIVKPVGVDSEHKLPEMLKAELGGEFFTVHRLDTNVGGVMVYARTKKAAAELSRAITDGTMIKEYVALVEGIPDESGVLEDLLWKDPKKNKVFVVNRMRGGVKDAKLEYTHLSVTDGVSLVRVRLYTGRSHQIRVQFASRGFPLVGDKKYGSRKEGDAPMLYSFKLTFPYGGKTVSFEDLPDWAEQNEGKC